MGKKPPIRGHIQQPKPRRKIDWEKWKSVSAFIAPVTSIYAVATLPLVYKQLSNSLYQDGVKRAEDAPQMYVAYIQIAPNSIKQVLDGRGNKRLEPYDFPIKENSVYKLFQKLEAEKERKAAKDEGGEPVDPVRYAAAHPLSFAAEQLDSAYKKGKLHLGDGPDWLLVLVVKNRGKHTMGSAHLVGDHYALTKGVRILLDGVMSDEYRNDIGKVGAATKLDLELGDLGPNDGMVVPIGIMSSMTLDESGNTVEAGEVVFTEFLVPKTLNYIDAITRQSRSEPIRDMHKSAAHIANDVHGFG